MKILLIFGVLVVVAGIGMLFWIMDSEPSSSNSVADTMVSTNDSNETSPQPSGAGESSDTKLDLRGKGLTVVDLGVFSMTELTELDLSNNNLSGALQAEIRHLSNLKKLDLSDNQFTGVPAEIGQLKNLEVLDLSNNKLTGLPNELGNLSNLKSLDLRGNAYAEADLANIKKSLPASAVVLVD